VTFSIAASSSGVCTAGGTNGATITIVATGTCTVVAARAGGNGYAPIQVSQSFTIGPALLRVTVNQTAQILGTLPPLTVSYSGFVNNEGPSVLGGTLQCTPLDPSVKITSSGQLPATDQANTYLLVCSGQTSSNYQILYQSAFLTLTNPVPTVSGLSQAAVQAGSGNLTLTISGSNFVAQSYVLVEPPDNSGPALTPTSLSSDGTALTVTVPSALLAAARTLQVKVVNPGHADEPAVQALFVTAAASTVSAETVSMSGTATVGGAGSGTAGSVTLSASGGSGMVAVAQYTTNPGGTPGFSSSGAYFDAYVAPLSTYSSAQIVDCNLNGGSQAWWWNGTSWVLASNQTYNAATGCVTITVNYTSVPSIHQLDGTQFGIANVPPVVSVPGAQSVQYGGQLSFAVSATDAEVADKLTLHAGGLPAGLSFTDHGDGTATISGTLTAAAGPYTATFTANDGYGDSAPANVEITVSPAPLVITATTQSMLLHGSIPILTAGYSGFVNGDTASALITPPACTTTATSSSPVGSYPITCSGAVDPNYAISYQPGTLSVLYNKWSGFSQPINDPAAGSTPMSVFKAGSTVPVKFQLTDANGAVVQASTLPTFSVSAPQPCSAGAVDESVSTASGDTGTTYRWDSTGQQYLYNDKTMSTLSGQCQFIRATLDDGTTHSVYVGYK
jgi:hypothetical protein